eukprot:scaffold2155_cov125-Skeletonema_dohrnii-CCMP3373.AAC.6
MTTEMRTNLSLRLCEVHVELAKCKMLQAIWAKFVILESSVYSRLEIFNAIVLQECDMFQDGPPDYFLFCTFSSLKLSLLLSSPFRKTGWANQQSMAAGVQEVRSDEFPTDSNEKIEKVNQVLVQLTGSGLTTMLSHVDPAQQQALLAAGPAGALGILPSAQLASVADAALDVALGNIPTSGAGAVSPVPVNVAAAAAAAPIMQSPTVVAPAQSSVIATAPAASIQPNNVDDAKVIGRIDRPSNHILVHNMFDKDEETDPGWEEDIRLDFEEECAQYGKISS